MNRQRLSSLAVVTLLLGASTPATLAAQPVTLTTSVAIPPQEGNGGSNIATFTLQTNDTTRNVFLTVSAEAGTATGGSQCDGNTDFLNLANVGVTLTPTQRSRQVTVTLCGDVIDEPNETFTLRIAQTDGQQVTPNLVTATIVDDDPTPTLRINDVTVAEPAPGGTRVAAFTVTLSQRSGNEVRFSWETVAATTGLPASAGACGTAGADFVAVAPQPLTIAPGSTTASLSVTVCGDGVYEGTETLRVRLSAATSTSFADDLGVLSITDNEQPPTIAFAPSVSIANSPTNNLLKIATFTVTLAGTPTQRPVTFGYTTANGTATGSNSCIDVNLGGVSKKAGDYITTASAAETITPPSRTIQVPICKLRTSGSGKSFSLNIQNVANAAPATLSRSVLIP